MEGAGFVTCTESSLSGGARDALLHSAALVRITRCAHARETESWTVRVSPLFLLFYLLFGVVYGLFCVIKFEGSRNVR